MKFILVAIFVATCSAFTIDFKCDGICYNECMRNGGRGKDCVEKCGCSTHPIEEEILEIE